MFFDFLLLTFDLQSNDYFCNMSMEIGPHNVGDLTPAQLSAYINQLIDTDFPRLAQLLYQLDISEEKIRSALLTEPMGNTGDKIVELIMERLQQKAKSKRMFKHDDNIPDDERWQ